MIDTHCHFNHDQFSQDVDSALSRAQSAGVAAMIVVGFDMESSRLAVEFANKYSNLYAAIGVHPHDAKSWNIETAVELTRLAKDPRVVAIGEIGLDYFRDLSPRADQSRAFEEQVELALQSELPVIIHCREAYSDALDILVKWDIRRVGGVMHCWAGSPEEADRTIDVGLMLGIGGTVTYPKALNVHNAAQRLSLDRLLLETDAPYLSPLPHRGKRNEPSFLPIIAETIAFLRGLTAVEVAASTTANALRCFPRMSYPQANHDVS